MQRRHVELWAPRIDAHGALLAYGNWGRPLLVFPSEGGRAWEYETGGMVPAIAPLIEVGRVKLYCVDSFDEASWSNAAAPLEERSRAHERSEAWILEQVVRWIHSDCGGRAGDRHHRLQPRRLRPARRPPRVAAFARQPAARMRPGPLGRHHRPPPARLLLRRRDPR